MQSVKSRAKVLQIFTRLDQHLRLFRAIAWSIREIPFGRRNIQPRPVRVERCPDLNSIRVLSGIFFAHFAVKGFGQSGKDQPLVTAKALHWAVTGGQLSTIALLLERGAPLEDVNVHGGTPLGQALWSFANGDPETDCAPIFEALLAAGARIEDGSLGWLEAQYQRPTDAKKQIAEILRRYGAIT